MMNKKSLKLMHIKKFLIMHKKTISSNHSKKNRQKTDKNGTKTTKIGLAYGRKRH